MVTRQIDEKAVFNSARRIADAAARENFLTEACGDDKSAIQRIRELLRIHEHEQSFLESPAVDLTPNADRPSIAEQPGTLIGPYKLLEQIGEGGFGVVFLAEQERPIRRRVALKVIKPGMDTRAVVTRFEGERQALALMDHPNIAKVHDAGATENGRPYFVMELVQGVPITEYCDQCQLSTRERLELFVTVCQAVQHAHLKGIIHRDLKPTNVLVAMQDGKPAPKIIDFGVAKAIGEQSLTERTLTTAFAQMIGTPMYMSPEQAELSPLGVDTRSDIYSLGVLLYELLTGETPFDRDRLHEASYDELRRIIREEEPPRPSARLSTLKADLATTVAGRRRTDARRLQQSVRGELDWIVMKCLEKDRNRRYETASGLALDIQRYLDDEPVQACPPSSLYQLRKFTRRHKAKLATASVVSVALLFAVGSLGWAMRDRTVRHAKVAGQVELILSEIDQLQREQKWAEALLAARRADAVVIGGEADAATVRRVRESLKDLEFLDRLEQIRMQRATSIDGSKFNDAGSDRNYARAFRDYGVDVDALPVEMSIDRLKARPALVIPLAAALDDWVFVRRNVSESDAARWKRLVAVARGIDAEPLRDRLRSTWGQSGSETEDELRRLAESIDVRAQHPTTLLSLARTFRRGEHSDSGLRLLRDAQYVYPGDFWLNFELGSALSQQNDHEGAVRFYTAAASIRPRSSAAYVNLGNALKAQKKLDEAIAAYRKAIELDPKNAMAYRNLGVALRDQEKLDEAVAAYRKAIELDPKNAMAYSNLGNALRDQQKLDEAMAAFREAIELVTTPEGLDQLNVLAYLLRRDGDLEQARELRGRVVERAKTLFPAEDARRVKYQNDYFQLLLAMQRYEEAETVAGDALKSLPSQETSSRLMMLRSLVNLYQQWNKPEEADRYQQLVHSAEAEQRASTTPTSEMRALDLNNQAWSLAASADPQTRDPHAAVELAQEAVKLAPNTADFWNTLGVARYRAGDFEGAIAALQKYRELRTSDAEYGNPFFLAMAHWQLGHKEEAREWFDKGAQWMERQSAPSATLQGFRREAAELLGVIEPQSPSDPQLEEN